MSYQPRSEQLPNDNAIILAIRALPSQLQDAFVTRREHDALAETLKELKVSIDNFTTTVRQDYADRRSVEEFKAETRKTQDEFRADLEATKKDDESKHTAIWAAINSSNTQTTNRFLGNSSATIVLIVTVAMGVLGFFANILSHVSFH